MTPVTAGPEHPGSFAGHNDRHIQATEPWTTASTCPASVTWPRISRPAPPTGCSVQRLHQDHWTILFSHPADFTPVCTTELSSFAENGKWFADHHTKLIGLSIDSIHSHVAWVNNVHEKTGVYMDFPIIADIDMKVAKLYGMLHENTSNTAAVRAVFFIDPKGIIRPDRVLPAERGAEHGRDHARAPGAPGRRRERLRHAGELASGRQGDRASAQDPQGNGGPQGGQVARDGRLHLAKKELA